MKGDLGNAKGPPGGSYSGVKMQEGQVAQDRDRNETPAGTSECCRRLGVVVALLLSVLVLILRQRRAAAR